MTKTDKETTDVILSIIIVNYNTPYFVYNCLKSIKKNLRDIKYEIIIVDNSSKPELKINEQELKEATHTTCYLLHTTNNGFGAANNLAAQKAKGKYLFLLNSDTIIVDNSIQKMYEFIIQHKEIGALTCLLYNDLDNKKLQKYFYGNFQSLTGLTIRRYNYQKIDPAKEFFYTDIVTGAALMIKRELFEQIGGFDEKFFMYLEDDDLCRRIVDLGYKNAVLDTAKIVHLESKSTNNKERKKYYYRSQELYWQKHNGFLPTTLMKIIRWPLKMIKTNK